MIHYRGLKSRPTGLFCEIIEDAKTVTSIYLEYRVSMAKLLTNLLHCVYDKSYELKVVIKRSTSSAAAREGASQAERDPGRGDTEGSF